MKKILLVGEFNGVLESISKCAEDDYQVQICIPVYENVKGMLRIIKPDLVILSQVGSNKVGQEIYTRLTEFWSAIPVLVIGTKEEWNACKAFCNGKQFHNLFRPVTKRDILEKCRMILGEEKKELATEEKDNTSLPRACIMIVDDSPIVLRNVKGMLENEYDVVFAPSGEKALEIAELKKIDLILLDYEMKGMNGAQTFDRLKKIEKNADTPVLFLTGVSDRERTIEVLSLHPAGYILKPLDRDKIINAIKEIL